VPKLVAAADKDVRGQENRAADGPSETSLRDMADEPFGPRPQCGNRMRLTHGLYRSTLLRGHVTHSRLRPVPHSFRYAVSYFLFDVDELSRLDRELAGFGYNRWRPVCVFDGDYGRPPCSPLRESIERFVRLRGIATPLDRIELLTQARIFGYVFNPVSYFYCRRSDGTLVCIVAEVNNTFGDRIRYLFDERNEVPWVGGRGFRQPKQMHVSPFMPMDLEYVFGFSGAGNRLSIHVDESERGERFFMATLTGRRTALTGRTLWQAVLRFPLMPLQITGYIHWEALRLYWKRAPSYSRPPFDERWARSVEGE
jgi:DUF1365 family protein